jgi:phosphopantetheine--protein transferase-like protein
VDLCHPQAIARYEDQRFINRVLTPAEQEILRSSSFPNQCLWSFWAAKESAYKAISRSFPLVSSSPKQYEVSIDDIGSPFVFHGIVTTPELPVKIQGEIRIDYVYCLGVTGKDVDDQTIETGIYPIPIENLEDIILPDQESSFVRKLAKDRIAAHLGVKVYQIQIRRKIIADQPGPPEVFVQGEKIPVNISLSHDGRFVAFAFTRLDT